MNESEFEELLENISPLQALGILVFVYAGAMVATYFLSRGDWTAVQTVATVLGGLILIWYTWETQLLRQESQRQTELQLRPCVIAEYRQGAGLILINIGNAPALNLQIDDIIVDKKNKRSIIVFVAFHMLKPAEPASVERMKTTENGREDYSYYTDDYIDPAKSKGSVDIRVNYTNIDMKRYSTITRISRGKIVILNG